MEHAAGINGEVGEHGGILGIMVLLVFAFVVVLGYGFMKLLKQQNDQQEKWITVYKELHESSINLQRETNDVIGKLSDKIEPCKFYMPQETVCRVNRG